MKTEGSQYISLAEAAKLTSYSQDYISLLCRQGKLKAEKLGRNWVTTKEWVYNYVDSTEGKGESLVPVRVKSADSGKTNKADSGKADSGKKEIEVAGKEVSCRRPLFGSTILEMTVFCAALVVLLANALGFVRGIKEIDYDYNLVQRSASVQNEVYSKQSSVGEDVAAASQGVQQAGAADMCSAGESQPSLNLVSFDKETDQTTIDKITKQITSSLSTPADVEVYKKFAIVTYKSNPQQKFLYMLNGA